MSREVEARLADMREACERILGYVARGGATWAQDAMVTDAVIRNLEVLGEAAKHIPDATRAEYPTIAWPKLCGLRDVLIHQYFGVDVLVLQSVVSEHLPKLLATLTEA